LETGAAAEADAEQFLESVITDQVWDGPMVTIETPSVQEPSNPETVAETNTEHTLDEQVQRPAEPAADGFVLTLVEEAAAPALGGTALLQNPQTLQAQKTEKDVAGPTIAKPGIPLATALFQEVWSRMSLTTVFGIGFLMCCGAAALLVDFAPQKTPANDEAVAAAARKKNLIGNVAPGKVAVVVQTVSTSRITLNQRVEVWRSMGKFGRILAEPVRVLALNSSNATLEVSPEQATKLAQAQQENVWVDLRPIGQ
jgi:hypothetical protein